mmetsp:Transcript_24185/g.50276  ORF Transcript_24185/g.50276 Transcript_24185/m.50276 type:complete len:106 (-) Transcript_24185:591-908(-)
MNAGDKGSPCFSLQDCSLWGHIQEEMQQVKSPITNALVACLSCDGEHSWCGSSFPPWRQEKEAWSVVMNKRQDARFSSDLGAPRRCSSYPRVRSWRSVKSSKSDT